MPFRSITIDHTQCGSSNSTNFPVLFAGVYSYLATTANGGKVANASGFDIVPYADSGLTTKLNFERASWNASTGAIELWIQLPTLSASTNTVFYLAYGNAAVTTDQQNIAATWSNGFALVFHLNDTPSGSSGSLVDSVSGTGFISNVTVGSGGSVARGTGKVGPNDLTTTPTGEYNFQCFTSSTTASGMGTGPSSLSGWFYRNTDNHSGYDGPGFLFGRPNSSYPYAAFFLRLEKAGGVSFQAGANGNVLGPSSAVATNAWHHAAATYDSTNGYWSLYVDGALQQSGSNYDGLRDDFFQIGGSFTIAYDEVRGSSVLRSADWLLAEYNNQNAPASFYTVGSETSANLSFSFSGIPTAEIFGFPTVIGKVTRTQTGIASAEAFGAPSTKPNWKSTQTGISSAEAFGTVTRVSHVTLPQTGMSSAEAFGLVTTKPNVKLTQTGIVSAEAFGATTRLPKRTTTQTGISSSEAFGTVTTIQHNPATIFLTGIPSAEAFGTVRVIQQGHLVLNGIPSAEAFGTPTVTAHPPIRFMLAGIPSAEAFGTYSQSSRSTRTLSGILTAEAFGTYSLRASTRQVLSGIGSSEAFGSLTLHAAVHQSLSGIPSAEAFGGVAVAFAHILHLTGIASTEAFGTPALSTAFATVTTFPNGQVLTSWAMPPAQLNMTMQALSCAMLGIDPTADPNAYSKVRLQWPTGGQPAFAITDDVCFLKVTEEEDAYSHIRDRKLVKIDGQTVSSTDTYTRVWRVSWALYGPNSFDHARLIRSALLTADFPHDTLSALGLYLVTDMAATTRAPELFSGQWWDRTDLSVKLNELVTETLTVPSIASADVLIYNNSGEIAEVDIL